MRKIVQLVLLFSIATIISAAAVNATPIQFNVGNFIGQWGVQGVTGLTPGNQTIDLGAGAYNVQIAGIGTFQIVVDASGNVTVTNGVSAVGGLQSVLFNTVPVTIDPVEYDLNTRAEWSLLRVDDGRGVKTLDVVPSVSYRILLGRFGSFDIDVDAVGGVTVQNGVSAVGGANSLTFNTVNITIDPGAYDTNFRGNWEVAIIHEVQSSSNPGPQVAVLVPAVSYRLQLGRFDNFVFDVDAVGGVTVPNGISGVGGLQSLMFNTETIEVDPGNFTGTWTISTTARRASGIATAELVPEVDYLFAAGSDTQVVSISAPCAASPDQFVLDGADFEITCVQQGPVEIETNADSFMRQGAKDRNEGANPMMRVRKSGKNRALVGFDAQAINDFGTVTKATLRLNIQDIGNNWGSGRTVDAHPLIVDFVEGNGKGANVPGPEQTRGNGSGVTWNCAIDTDISNQKADCDPKWKGGNFSAATASGVTHTSGMSGAVEWDVTADVLSGATSWLIKKTEEGQNGLVEYYSREGAADAGNSSLAPTLILE